MPLVSVVMQAFSQLVLAAPTLPRAPEWQGWLALGILVIVFGLLLWWLFFSPLKQHVRPAVANGRVLRVRRVLAGLVLLSGVFMSTGARWDELWHRLYGGFGNDFLWPPHMLIYCALGMTGVFAGVGLLIALRGQGGLRQRFRAEPLLGLLGLLSAYEIASIPSDLLWHEIIGPDITALSLPHVLLALTSSAAKLIGIAIALSTLPTLDWRGLTARWRGMEVVVLGLIAVITLDLLQAGTTEWEWFDSRIVLLRPAWSYPITILLLGTAGAFLALYTTRRVGSATLVALAVLLAHAATVAVYRASLPPGPALSAHLLLVAPALALDVWYALRLRHPASPLTRWGSVLIYYAMFWGTALPYLGRFVTVEVARQTPMPILNLINPLDAMAIGLPVALVAGYLFAQVGNWLRVVGGAAAKEAAAPEALARPALSV